MEKEKYTLAELNKMFGVPIVTLRYWIKKGWLKSSYGEYPFRKNMIFISREDWLDFPTFIRNRYTNK